MPLSFFLLNCPNLGTVLHMLSNNDSSHHHNHQNKINPTFCCCLLAFLFFYYFLFFCYFLVPGAPVALSTAETRRGGRPSPSRSGLQGREATGCSIDVKATTHTHTVSEFFSDGKGISMTRASEMESTALGLHSIQLCRGMCRHSPAGRLSPDMKQHHRHHSQQKILPSTGEKAGRRGYKQQ